ncbi:GDSL-type esterase/lipase family protein [Glutamicibacter mishrai]|uniref:GDSL-type esterase/lipase family protein n=1 Tax=Glutamicibacter mishrai TaxID=1775880 RepID=UPI0020CD253D|nr:GDSL-type esterase/lipase family protein [Glutamicibacter mishrai]UTT40261.1 GDSL-type esterase/lipase family protein [Glutamicibacter mishrai]UTT40312.1 GDSL-type esterase/lipase family protein [Glutamicibacter mishrai]
MAWVTIANLKGVPGDAASLAELANRPKSTVPNLAVGTNLNTMHQQSHVGWWPFFAADVTNEPAGMGSAAAMLEVIAPNQFTAVQRVHDRNSRTTYERSVIDPNANTWSPWQSFAMNGDTLIVRGVIGHVSAFGNLDSYKTTEDMGFWTLWAPYNYNTPKDARGRCTLRVLVDPGGFVTHELTERESGRKWSRGYNGTTWDPWVDLSANAGYTPFKKALSLAKTRNVNIVAIGDSNTEGYHIDAGLNERWINKLQPALNRVAGNAEGATYPFIPAKYNMDGVITPNLPVTITGNFISGGYEWGYGWRAATLRDGTAKAVFTFTGTKASVMYVEGSSAGIMDVSIDGGAATAVNTNKATVNPARRWDTGALAYGEHTITVTLNAGSAPGQVIFLEGILTWANDETRGVRIIDAGYSGQQMVGITSAKAASLSLTIAQTGDVDLVLVNLATNDTRHNSDLDEYRAAAEGIVNAIRARGQFMPIVFILPFIGADHTRGEMGRRGLILGNTASNMAGVQFVDLSLSMPKIPADQTTPEAQGLYSDDLHMSAQGHTIFAGHVLRALLG